MELVEDHEPDAGQRRVLLEAPGEDPFGDDLDAGPRADAALVPGAVADGPADLLAEQRRHPPGGRSRRQPAGFEHHDPTARQPRLVEQSQRYDGRLARPGRRL